MSSKTTATKDARAKQKAAKPTRHDVLAAFSRITERDRQILLLLAKHQVLTTHQITRALFSCSRVARTRLETLENVGIITTFRPPLLRGTSPKHAVLTPLGATTVAGWLDERHAAPVPKDAAVRLAARPDLRHLLGVNDFFCSLAGAARQAGDAELELWWSERACTRTWGALVRPDGFGRWREGIRSVDFFLEYDTGVEGLSQVIAKLPGYAALADSTGYTSPVLFWLHSARREKELHRKLDAASPRVPIATASGDPAVIDPSGPIWRVAGAEGERVRLSDLEPLTTKP